MSTSMWGTISNICCNLRMRTAHVLMQRDPLNILIVRCTGNFGSSCIIIVHYFVVNKSNYQGAYMHRVNGTAIVLDIYPVIN
jgi:hypothetical protein